MASFIPTVLFAHAGMQAAAVTSAFGNYVRYYVQGSTGMVLSSTLMKKMHLKY